jgi:hypothetical protein
LSQAQPFPLDYWHIKLSSRDGGILYSIMAVRAHSPEGYRVLLMEDITEYTFMESSYG